MWELQGERLIAGYMREHGVERVWRDTRLNRIGAGTDAIMLDVIGRSYGL
jgi:alkylation response protein AidB-like acyl-CoA dehydrogenase